ncbi:MAG: GtrA family protein, partial [Candidatus Doudnabacteria bacterium]|nr:GtrA family protein [Candidatus Doudnabacteria bacterium]
MSLTTQISSLIARRPIILQFMRFVCIGLLNTALDFLLLNTVSKALGITQGLPLGFVSSFSFTMAVIQSYLWNRTWTFGGEVARLKTNFFRLILVGTLGAVFIISVLAGSRYQISWYYFLIMLCVYLYLES